MQPKIIELSKKLLVGQQLNMSLTNNKTHSLWSKFAPRIKEVENKIGDDKLSMQVYPLNYFKAFNPNLEFTKWAAVEVANFDAIPANMETFILEKGLYAVFHHKGSDTSIFNYIFSEWIPKSKYNIDNRPHFELLGEKYKNNDPNSEEEIWIPIIPKNGI